MKKMLLLITMLISSKNGNTQNLVGNFSFEEFSQCPFDLDQVPFATGWENWCATPDYYNECTDIWGLDIPLNWQGFQYPDSGHAYVGVFTYWSHHIGNNLNVRDYVAVKLDSTLVIGQNYFIHFRVSLSDESTCGSSKIGALFTSQSFAQYGNVSFTSPLTSNFAHINNSQLIEDTVGWHDVSGDFLADSAYNYIVIGNFYDDAHTDTTLMSSPYCYVYFYVDDISIFSVSFNGIEESNRRIDLNIFPNPTSDILTINPYNFSTGEILEVLVYNSEGGKQKQVKIYTGQSIDVSNLKAGFYLLQVSDGIKICHGYFIKQ